MSVRRQTVADIKALLHTLESDSDGDTPSVQVAKKQSKKEPKVPTDATPSACKPTRPKKERTEAQKAATARMLEANRLKREQRLHEAKP